MVDPLGQWFEFLNNGTPVVPIYNFSIYYILDIKHWVFPLDEQLYKNYQILLFFFFSFLLEEPMTGVMKLDE